MKVVFLGTGASRPTKERGVSSIAVKYRGEVILFDCGENAQRQMVSLIKPSKITSIFISHFHGDHVLGIPGLLMTMSLSERTEPLDIYGPEKTIYFLKNMLKSGYFGINFDVNVHEIEDGGRVNFGEYYIQSFKTDHGVPSLGYIFKENDRRGSFIEEKTEKLGINGKMFSKLERNGEITVNGKNVTMEELTGPKKTGKSIIYTGDTLPVDIPFKKCDLLIHESTFLNEKDRNNTFHSTVKDACEAARDIGAKKLILTHISQRYDPGEIEKKAREYIDSAEVAEDLAVIEL
ncbi:MAG: ribonuclease Z [Euryarchaeota archaeon]|nr:ribonuclease Z [Euryarchaeota archaeon]